ncbi:MAG: alpha/beta fold hydrolase [Propionibacteriaceae bacterium]|jgi:pimeloyl-ACP methyl ester carboxylesterase
MRATLAAQPVLFIQGAGGMYQPEGSGRLAAYLARELGAGYRVIAPEMPDADDPHYQPWRDRIEQELEALDQAVILVGHSFGGSVLLKYSLRARTRSLSAVCFLSRSTIGGQMAGRMRNSRCQMMLV